MFKYNVTYGIKFNGYTYKEYYTDKFDSLEKLSDYILDIANFKKDCLPIEFLNNFDKEAITEDSFKFIKYKKDNELDDNSEYTLVEITKEIDMFKINSTEEKKIAIKQLNNSEKGYVFSSGKYTHGIIHCSSEFMEWLDDLNKKINNIEDEATRVWNFLE